MGFSGVPPPGPAIPVIEQAIDALERASAPSAIAIAHSRLTAPYFLSISRDTPSISCFASLVYVTNPRSTTSDEPAIAVSAAQTRPPVQLSAAATMMPLVRHFSRML